MGVHDGHRERLKSRFFEYGLESFNDLNALELLLFYAIPRRDTNLIAHGLLDKFESLEGVFRASKQELCEVEGIGENAAGLILLIPQMMKKSMVSATKKICYINNSDDAGAYLVPRFMGEQDEVAYMLCLDSQRRLIKCSEIGRGAVNSVNINLRVIVETALKLKANSVIISHNHPDGIALPSAEDDAVTRQVAQSLSMVGIYLADHIVVAGDDFVSYADSNMLRF